MQGGPQWETLKTLITCFDHFTQNSVLKDSASTQPVESREAPRPKSRDVGLILMFCNTENLVCYKFHTSVCTI